MKALGAIGITLVVALLTSGAAGDTESPPSPAPPTAGIPLAITVDDLPFVGGVGPGDTTVAAIGRILAASGQRHVPVAGFVACRNIEPVPGGLERWLAGGITVGNHSWSHRSLDSTGLDAWRADIERCQALLAAASDRPVTLFRYPFLQTGRDRALRDAGFATLAELGLRRAPVSIDTAEWALVKPYLAALEAGDAARVEAIGLAYRNHLRNAARRAVRVATELGRPRAAQILLLHANALAADHLGEVLDQLAADGFSFVTIDEALADPVYDLPDQWVGGIGLSWLYRVDPAVNAVRRWTWEAAQEHAMQVRFGGAEENPAYDLDRDLSVRRVADHTWVVTDALPWSANSLLAEMPDGTLLLADTPTSGYDTRSLLDWLEVRFGRRPLVVVNSHFHPDALGGNRVLATVRATTYGSTTTVRLLAEHRAALGASLAADLAQRPLAAAEFTPWDPLPPQQTFDQAEGLQLSLGGEPVEVLFPGPAHSPDNLVVWLPARGVLFGSCLVRSGDSLGPLDDADLDGWPAAVRRLQQLHPAIVVPGHGDRTDPALLPHTLALLAKAATAR